MISLFDAFAAASPDLSALLPRFAAGDESVAFELTPKVYDELRRVARNHLRSERGAHTLQATGLVNEAYLRMCESTGLAWQDRLHFFRLASRVMRNVLVDHARARQSAKRGGDVAMTSLDSTAFTYAEKCTQHLYGTVGGVDTAIAKEIDFIALDESIRRLHRLSPRQAEVVQLRFFADLSIEDTAEAMAVSAATVKREWAVARLFLQQDILRQRGYRFD